MSTYKPTEHGGLKEDGTPDKRVKHHKQDTSSSSSEEQQAHQDQQQESELENEESHHHLHEAHRIEETGDGTYKPSEHNGVTKDGTHYDQRLSEPTVQLYREEEVEGGH